MIYGVYGAGGHGCEAMQVFLSNLHLVQEANLIDLFFVETYPISKSLNDIQIISEEAFLRKKDFPLNFTVAIGNILNIDVSWLQIELVLLLSLFPSVVATIFTQIFFALLLLFFFRGGNWCGRLVGRFVRSFVRFGGFGRFLWFVNHLIPHFD